MPAWEDGRKKWVLRIRSRLFKILLFYVTVDVLFVNFFLKLITKKVETWTDIRESTTSKHKL